MKLHELRPPQGSHRRRKRVGRGISAGQGKTAGRGQKGQFARSSPNLPKSFEGGQMPLSQRLPKLRGFHNPFRKDYATVNLGKLRRYEAGSTVDEAALRASGLISGRHHGVKVLGAGELHVPLHLHVHRVSAHARAAIEKAGGTVTLLELVTTSDAHVKTEGTEAPQADTASGSASANGDGNSQVGGETQNG